MTWDFETDPEFAAELAWVDEFVRERVEPIDLLITDPWDTRDPLRNDLIVPLQDEVKARGLWACHLGPELGGQGYGQVRLGLMNEHIGRSLAAPIVFGAQAPDSGNSEILAHFGTPDQKVRYLEPLLDGRIVSCFSMTEPQGGSDPEAFTTTAVLEGDEWVINGEKWYSSNAVPAAFFIVMAVSEPDGAPYRRQSMFIVPAETPGIEIIRNTDDHHAYVRYTDVRVPFDHLLGGRGEAFAVAQTRLGGGRVHHAMRTVGMVRHCFELMCRRAVSRTSKGERLADKQLVQAAIAESWCQIESFRLLVLQTAWKIDRYQDYKLVSGEISAIKTMMPKVLHDVASRALQIHGSIGTSEEMPFLGYIKDGYLMGLADGPTEVHLTNLARALLRDVTPDDDLFPDYHVPRLREKAEELYRDVLEKHGRLEPADLVLDNA